VRQTGLTTRYGEARSGAYGAMLRRVQDQGTPHAYPVPRTL